MLGVDPETFVSVCGGSAEAVTLGMTGETDEVGEDAVDEADADAAADDALIKRLPLMLNN